MCSVCAFQRPIDEFRVNKQGKIMKTCLKHSKKRDISQISCDVDLGDSFLHEIKTFNQTKNTNQIEKINVSYSFDLDQLPVDFGLSLETCGVNAFDLVPLNQAIGALLEEQEAIGNHKFLEVYFNHKSNLESNRILLNEINQRKRQRTMPATWSRNKHPATMYYK